jgi:hypothetical protein
LEDGQLPLLEAVKSLIDVYHQERLAVNVLTPKLSDYDQLLNRETH